METYEIAALLTAAVLGLDALLHVYWMTGRTWPARDVTTLSRGLLNADVPFTPRVLAPLVLILSVGAVAVLARADVILPGLPGWLPAAGAAAVAAGLALRAGAGLVWALGVGARKDSVFYKLNLALYTPVCLLLTAATIDVVMA
ncbi:DUF3995 domain-containing protein [Actinomadura opuntiae]|uniref:DUF3995 domain-containing protein n=1 Tax=Actinomadura sp. OS1-43 TaxID=604315 RepID=UPI00255AAF5B|nr:DUF3995 domain-containing protein [Actinomadura sp. OS1-43]MDL4819012.1 DUF3995 domain-containing protein [Actinomadura sp. OS1-43]